MTKSIIKRGGRTSPKKKATRKRRVHPKKSRKRVHKKRGSRRVRKWCRRRAKRGSRRVKKWCRQFAGAPAVSAAVPRLTQEEIQRLLNENAPDISGDERNIATAVLLDTNYDPNYSGEFYVSHAQRVAGADRRYVRSLEAIPAEIAEARADIGVQHYTEEMRQSDEQAMRDDAEEQRVWDMQVANSYSNDMENQAVAMITEWNKYGFPGEA